MRVKVSGCLGAQTCTESINKVTRKHSIYRTYIYFARCFFSTCLNKVFYKSLSPEYNILKAFYLFYIMNECIHGTFTFCKFHLSVFLPKGLITHHSVSLFYFLLFTFKQLLRQLVKSKIAHPCSTYNYRLLKSFDKRHFSYHVVCSRSEEHTSELQSPDH